jgi:hypothetical protein
LFLPFACGGLSHQLQNLRTGPVTVVSHRVTFTALPPRRATATPAKGAAAEGAAAEGAAGAGPAVGGPEALGRQWFSAAAAAPEGTETEVPAPVVVVFEGPGVGGDTHFIGGRGDFNFGNPKEQVVSKSKQKWR